MLILAESDTGQTAVLMVIAGLIGGGINWLAAFWSNHKKVQRREAQEDETARVKQLESLLERADAEIVEVRERLRNREEKLSAARIKFERASVWIRHLEEKLAEANVKFRPWSDSAPEVT